MEGCGLIILALFVALSSIAFGLAQNWYVYGLWPISWGAYAVFVGLALVIGLITQLLKRN